MKSLTFISDTHCRHHEIPKHQLPGGDFLVHTGDFTNNGNIAQCTEFFAWFEEQTQYKHRIFIAGNHELIAEQNPGLFQQLIPSNCVYLNDSGVTLEGLKFWGTPATAQFCNWAFNKTDSELTKHFGYTPEDTDVLLTHGGPLGFLQELENNLDIGMEPLLEVIKNLPALKINAFGHVHCSRGVKHYLRHKYDNKTIMVNSAIVGDKLTHKPITISI